MNNIIKLLSVNKDYRVVVADISQMSEMGLHQFTGPAHIRRFLEEIMTQCTLLSAVNDFNQKISFTFRFSKGISIFCRIAHAKFSIVYTDSLCSFKGTVAELLHHKAVLSVTTGDWETGLHTGTVEAHYDSVGMMLSHFTVQSEQLPAHFIMAGNSTTRGILIQPLPFAAVKTLAKEDAEFVYLSTALEQSRWEEVASIYSDLANVVSENKIEIE